MKQEKSVGKYRIDMQSPRMVPSISRTAVRVGGESGVIKGKALLLAIACALLGALPQSASAAMVTVVHGINGSDLSLPSDLPVDIAVNGNCALKGVKFTQTTRVELAAGTYSITVHPATGSCSASAVINQQVTVPSSVRYIGLVANLSNAGTPQLTAFVNDSEYRRSVRVNNAAANTSIFAGAGPKEWLGFYGKPLKNGMGIFLLGDPYPSRIIVKLIQSGKKRAFFSQAVRLKSQRVYYVLGSRRSGLRTITEDLG